AAARPLSRERAVTTYASRWIDLSPRVRLEPRSPAYDRSRSACVQVQPTEEALFCGAFAEPSGGLEPSIPSLPCDPNANRWQPVATVFPLFKPFWGLLATRTFATRWRPSVPQLFDSNRPKTRSFDAEPVTRCAADHFR